MGSVKRIYRFFNRHEETIFFVLLLFLVFSFSFSRFWVRTFEFALAGVLIISGNYRKKILQLKNNQTIFILSSFFLLYGIGLIYVHDFEEGFKTIRVMLPWLILPLVIGSYQSLSDKKLHTLLKVYVLGVFIYTLISLLTYLGLFPGDLENYRELGLYYTLHRFALLITISIFFLYYLLRHQWNTLYKVEKTFYIPVFIWLICFLFFTRNLTGISSFVLISVGYILYLVFSSNKRTVRFASLGLFAILFTAGLYALITIYNNFWGVPEIETSELPKETVNGNKYLHDTTSIFLENGHYVNLYICHEELEKGWEKRSEVSYYGYTQDSSLLRRSLIRYLASKGLKKDSLGLSELKEKDIHAIEQGIINYKFIDYGLDDRLYNLGRELYLSQKLDKPTGTLTKRLFAVKYGIELWTEQPITGYGTNSLLYTFNRYYEEQNKTSKYYIPVHNQYMRYLIEFGVIGLIWFLISLFYPWYKINGYRSMLFNSLLLYFLLASTMNNTFSNQLSLTVFTTFYSLYYVYLNDRTKARSIDFKARAIKN